MSDQPVQNYENHVRNDKVVFTVLGTYLLVILLAVVGIFTNDVGILTRDVIIALAVVVAGAGGILSAVMTRGYSTKLQDRIIRLEMRLRMREVLPDELAADIMDFKLSQLVDGRTKPWVERGWFAFEPGYKLILQTRRSTPLTVSLGAVSSLTSPQSSASQRPPRSPCVFVGSPCIPDGEWCGHRPCCYGSVSRSEQRVVSCPVPSCC